MDEGIEGIIAIIFGIILTRIEASVVGVFRGLENKTGSIFTRGGVLVIALGGLSPWSGFGCRGE